MLFMLFGEALSPTAAPRDARILAPGALTSGAAGDVCVSLAAYEPAPWIDRLLENALDIGDPRGLVLHLDKVSAYSHKEISRWDSMTRVRVTRDRVAVEKVTG
eukprot:1541717-Prymnesium_polylepis.1